MRLASLRVVAVVILVPALVLSLAPFTSAQKKPPQSQPAAPDRITELEKQIGILREQIRILRSAITNLMPSRTAYLDCNSKKYVELRFAEGALVFFAACVNVEPYLEGHKVHLRIGNPHSFDFSDLKGRLHYGKTFEDAFNQEVEVSPTETLRGGTWLLVTVIINPSKPEDLREVWLELDATSAIGSR